MSFNSNIFKIGSTNEQVKNFQQCKVVINSPFSAKDSTVAPSIRNTDVKYPSKNDSAYKDHDEQPQIIERNITLDETNTSTNANISNVFYKQLSSILSNILSKHDAKLIANIWDRTGNIILSGSELCIIISSLCDVDVNSISIVYADDDPGCLTKIKPLKSIVNIKIDNRDFNLFYNEQYNILHDDFKISMNKVFIY